MKLLLSFGLLILQLSDTLGSDSCTVGCHPLVSGVYGVPDASLTASSQHRHGFGPRRARLHSIGRKDSVLIGAWCAKHTRKGEWIQVRFKTMQEVHRVQTQGRNVYDQWVTQYKVSTSKDCKTFTDYKEHGKLRVFSGNFDRNTVVTHNLNPVKALCFRITELAFVSHPSLRFEVLGHRACPDGYTYWHGSCYNLIQEKLSWTEAQWYCSWRGGHLITVDSQAENDWIKTYLLKQESNYMTMKYKECQEPALSKQTGINCLYFKDECLKVPNCTAVVLSRKGNECWAKAGCTEEGLVQSSKFDTTLLTARVSNIWINMNCLATGRNWETDPEKPATFLNWAHNQPRDDTTQHCAYMSPVHGHRWLSGECHDRFYFICEG